MICGVRCHSRSIRLAYIVCSFGVNSIRVQRRLNCSVYSIIKAHSVTDTHTQTDTHNIKLCTQIYSSYGMCTHSPVPIPIPIPIEFCHSDINGNADLLFTLFPTPSVLHQQIENQKCSA